MDADQTPPDANDRHPLLRSLYERKDELEADLDEKVDDLETLLFSRNPFSVLGNVWLANSILDFETYQETTHEGNDAYTEYVATVYLTRALALGEHEGLAPLRSEELQSIQELVAEIFMATTALHMARQYKPDMSEAELALSGIRFKTLLKNTAGRYPAYHHHLERTLRGIFSPIDDLLLDHFGFETDDALALAEAVVQVTTSKATEHIRMAAEARDAMVRAIEAYEKDGTVTDGHPLEFLEQGKGLDGEGRQRLASFIAITHSQTFLGWSLFFTADEIAEAAGVPVERARAFAERLSIRFGDVDPKWFRSPSATPPLQSRPLIQIGKDEHPLVDGDAFFCPVPQGLLWALRTNLEAGLNPAPGRDLAPLQHPNATDATWERYERARSRYAEARTLELFETLLPGATTYQGLKYDAPDSAGDVSETELDGLVLYDDTLFLIEVKAGTLSPPSRRGAPDRLAKELGDDLLGEGHRQALRAKAYVEGSDAPVFRAVGGVTHSIDMTKVRRVFMVVVTLEDLAAYTANLHHLFGTGLLASDTDLPWAVNIYDLETLAELVDSPSVLVHFLARRLAKDAEGKTLMTDEMDWIGSYVHTGLDFSAQTGGDPDVNVIVPSATTEIDDYFYFAHGPRETPAPKPAPPLPYPLSAIITELERSGQQGILPFTQVLLDLPHETRDTIATKIQACHQRAVATGKLKVFSAAPPSEDFGITYIAAPRGTPMGKLQSTLDGFVPTRKYQYRKERWLGIAAVAGVGRYVHLVLYNDAPWERNEQLDAALEGQGETVP